MKGIFEDASYNIEKLNLMKNAYQSKIHKFKTSEIVSQMTNYEYLPDLIKGMSLIDGYFQKYYCGDLADFCYQMVENYPWIDCRLISYHDIGVSIGVYLEPNNNDLIISFEKKHEFFNLQSYTYTYTDNNLQRRSYVSSSTNISTLLKSFNDELILDSLIKLNRWNF